MKTDTDVMKKDEAAACEMRRLYRSYGYTQFKMSRFEEYDLYVRNKDFLISDNIITFNDTDGRLMAMKPDVTLSIIKNSEYKKGCVQKVYYNENVYRVPKGSRSFKEIMQVGLECIGDVDEYNIYEVLLLAAKSLEGISADFVLDISQLDIVSAVVDSLGLDGGALAEVYKCIGEKNVYGINAVCAAAGVDGSALGMLLSAYGNAAKVAPVLEKLRSDEIAEPVDRLLRIVSLLEEEGFGDRVRIDFSVINDMNYYNGFVFKGFINGVASGVLAGGQYDKLMKKMNKGPHAIGFAVYLDMLERFAETDSGYDVDALILYDEDCDTAALSRAVRLLAADGRSVTAQKKIPEKLRYRQLLKLCGKGVEIIENNA